MAFKDKTQKEDVVPVAENTPAVENAPVVEAEKLVEVQADFKMEEVNAKAEVEALVEKGFKNAYVKTECWLFRVIAEKCKESEAGAVIERLVRAGYTPYVL